MESSGPFRRGVPHMKGGFHFFRGLQDCFSATPASATSAGAWRLNDNALSMGLVPPSQQLAAFNLSCVSLHKVVLLTVVDAGAACFWAEKGPIKARTLLQNHAARPWVHGRTREAAMQASQAHAFMCTPKEVLAVAGITVSELVHLNAVLKVAEGCGNGSATQPWQCPADLGASSLEAAANARGRSSH